LLFAHALSQVHCISQLQDGLFFVLTTVDNISPSLGFEILGRIVKILKDYCGILDEETVGDPLASSPTPVGSHSQCVGAAALPPYIPLAFFRMHWP